MKNLLYFTIATAALACTSPAAPDQAVMELGKTSFLTCAACHGMDGKGVQIPNGPAMAPPLAGSKLANGDPELLVAIVMKGIKKEDAKFLQIMLPLEAALDDEKLAAVATYVRNSFGNTSDPVTKEQAAAARAKYADRKTPFSRQEIADLAKAGEKK